MRNSSGRVNFTSKTPLTIEDLQRLAPSVFADHAHISRSDRYLHIPSSEIVKRMFEAGYHPFGVFQGGCRDEEKRGFTKHMIRFRHDSLLEKQVGDSMYEICLLNSHDGTSSYKLFAGVFRLVCENGLCVADGRIHETKLHHSIKNASVLVDESERVLNSLPEVNNRILQLQGIVLNDSQKFEFAEQANEATAKILNRPANLFPFKDLLNVRRSADESNDLWTVMNVVQENIIQGGIEYVREGGKHKKGTTKSIRHLQRNVDVNRELWKLTSVLADGVAA